MSEPHRYDIPKILEQMRADYWHSLETAAQDDLADLTDYMVVVFGTQRFGLPAAACREVLKVPRIVRVPRLPPHLPGIINLRGEIVAVTDLRPLLQLVAAPPTAAFRLVVVAAGSLRTALLVERVEGLCTISARAVEAMTEGATHGAADLFHGKLEDAGGLLLLDVGRLLARPDMVIDQKRVASDADE